MAVAVHRLQGHALEQRHDTVDGAAGQLEELISGIGRHDVLARKLVYEARGR